MHNLESLYDFLKEINAPDSLYKKLDSVSSCKFRVRFLMNEAAINLNTIIEKKMSRRDILNYFKIDGNKKIVFWDIEIDRGLFSGQGTDCIMIILRLD